MAQPALHDRAETRRIVAAIIGAPAISERTVRSMLREGCLPKPLRVGLKDYWTDAQLRRCAPRLRERERRKAKRGRPWKQIVEAAQAARP